MRGQAFKAWWQQYAGSIAFILLIVFGTIGFTRAEILANNIRDASVLSCQEANTQLEALHETYLQDAQRIQRLDSAVLFPNADPDVLQEAITQSVRFNRSKARLFQPVNCLERYPERVSILPFVNVIFWFDDSEGEDHGA